MTNRGSSDLAQQLLSLLQTYQAQTDGSSPSQTPATSASAIARSLRDDNVLADNVGRVLGSSSSASQQNRPLLPSLHQPSSSGRFFPYGRHFNGNTLMESPFRVRENELDPPIRARILRIIKSRFQSCDGTFFYASRQGRTIIKSTNNLYVMLSRQAPGNRPTDHSDEEELEVAHRDDVSVLQCINKSSSPFRSFLLHV